MRRAWVVVDLQKGFATAETVRLAELVSEHVRLLPGPVWALVQTNPEYGPLGRLLGWDGCRRVGDQDLLPAIAGLDPEIVTKSGYGTQSRLPVGQLAQYDAVMVVGADTDACVLATALGLFDAGVRVVVPSSLCLSSGGPAMHAAGLAVLTRQLGWQRVIAHLPPASP